MWWSELTQPRRFHVPARIEHASLKCRSNQGKVGSLGKKSCKERGFTGTFDEFSFASVLSISSSGAVFFLSPTRLRNMLRN